ncbi:LEM protein 2-like isoform X2 [Anthonomus grandis grandis]|uniref:LEM protein 2-like isoform X2 n=1 Tax=Anthonomus grandis grandis TaxID=2921223 RepID=UPI0021664B86|nr:LEM protein 2-like isoform X2 [Anthonomus grandis grandis]
MVDVDKLTDAELRTKLLEFGFPVMPITGTTRKVMTKKLKLLLENKNKVGSSDGRRSLGRYSSEEESDTEIKSKLQKNRRVTMAAPASSSTAKTTRKTVVMEPDVVSSSPKKVIKSTTTTRSSKIVKSVRDDFDTGSDSESDIVASSNKPEKSFTNDSYNDEVEFNRRSSPVKSASFSRYSPAKSTDDLSYSTTRNVSFGAGSSPGRHTSTTFGEVGVLSGSLASDYAADRLNQIRSRLSLGATPAYESRSSGYATTSPGVNAGTRLEDKDTPFLSNFTRKLTALSSAKKGGDYDSKNDLVKEHDTNGASYGRSYLTNFRATRGREPTYDYKTRRNSNEGKNNLVSYAVLVVAAAFFLVLAVVYLGMRSDTSVITSGYKTPLCYPHDPLHKKGVNCVTEEKAQNAVFLLNSIRPELEKRAVAHKCFDPKIKSHMTEPEIVTFCQTNYAIKDPYTIREDLRNLEVMIFANPAWGLAVAQTDDNNGAVGEQDLAKNMEQVIFNLDKKVTSLLILNPDLPYKCVFYNYVASAAYSLALLGIIFLTIFLMRTAFKLYRNYEEKLKDEVNSIVEKIIDILQTAASEDSDSKYVVINHVRDAILSVKDRKAKKKSWEKAVRYINENESRVRTEVQTVHGESFDVWRWIGSANVSIGGNVSRKGVWQGQAFDTDPGSANSMTFSPTPCLKIRGMLEEGAAPVTATAARDAVLSKVAHRCHVLHCQAEVASGVVYLKCGDEEDANVAFKNLHGWWYSGQLVTVKFLRSERYQQRFPDAPSGPPYLKSPNPCE